MPAALLFGRHVLEQDLLPWAASCSGWHVPDPLYSNACSPLSASLLWQ